MAIAGVFEAMSQGAYYLSSGFEGCPSVDETKANLALASARERCPSGVVPPKDPLQPLADVAMKVEGSQEDQLFALLGRQQGAELLCAADFADKIEKGDQTGLDNLEEKFLLLRQARQGLMAANNEIAQRPELLGTRCPLSLLDPDLKPEYWREQTYGGSDPVYEVCRKLLTYRTALEAITASIPLGGTKAVNQLMVNFSMADAAGPTEAGLRDQLKARIRAAYKGASGELRAESRRLEGLWRAGGTGFERAERSRLISDPLLVQSVLRQSGGEQDLRPLACRADARYGSGADALEDGLFVGSLALSGGAALALRGGSVAARMAMGVNSARAGGLLSLNAARALQFSALGVNAVMAYKEIDNACLRGDDAGLRAAGSGGDQCVSAPKIETLSQDSCYLAVGLGALGMGATLAPDLHAAVQKLRGRALSPGAAPAGTNADEVANASGTRAAAAGGTAEDLSPLRAKSAVTQAEVQTAHDTNLQRLATMGARTEKMPGDTALEMGAWGWIDVTDIPPGAANHRGFRGELHRIAELPPPMKGATGRTPALQHPEMAAALERVRALGYDVVIDTTVRNTGAGAYFGPGLRRIAIDSRTPWASFKHELEHLEFHERVRPHLATMKQTVAGNGSLVSGLPREVVADIGRDRVRRIEGLLRRGLTPTNAIDETLAVDAELRALGWHRYKPGGMGPPTAQYALRHQITDLRALEKRVGLTPEQKRTLAAAEQQHRLLDFYRRNGSVVLAGGAAVGGVTAGGGALLIDHLSSGARPYQEILYDANGNLIGVRPDGSWEYMKTGK